MPNETNNRLELTGNEDDIKKFIELHKVTVDNNLWWDFSKTIGLENEDDPDEREEKWGTRRCGLLNLSSNEPNVIYMETAWSPCKKWVETIIKQYPNFGVDYTYHDEFNEEYYGWMVGVNGSIVAQDELKLYFPMLIKNTIQMAGDECEIQKFIYLHISTRYGKMYWDFSKSVPCEDKDNMEKWGTSGSDSVDSIRHNEIIIKTFDTPCNKWFENIVKIYPSISFKYTYIGDNTCNYYGWMVGYEGSIITKDHICFDIDARCGMLELYKYKSLENQLEQEKNCEEVSNVSESTAEVTTPEDKQKISIKT